MKNSSKLMDLPLQIVEAMQESEMLLVVGGNAGLDEEATNNGNGTCSGVNNGGGSCGTINNGSGRCNGINNASGYCGAIDPGVVSKPDQP